MNKLNKPVNLIIADDHQLFVEGIVSMFAPEKEIDIIGHVHNSEELLKMLTVSKPDVIILDIKMPGMDGIKALINIKKKYTEIKVIMLSTYSDNATINNCIQNGADGYLFKNASADELRQAILGVHDNHKTFPNMQHSHAAGNAKFEYYAQEFNITKKEWDIMELIKAGHTNQRISEMLFRSIFTIQTHRKNLMQKLNLKSPAALTRFLIENEF